jgi:hypothetical protein
VAGDLGLVAEVGLDGLLAGGVLGGDVQELSCQARSLVVEHVDGCLIGHVASEGIDHFGISDVGKLIVLLGEALDVLSKGLISPLPVIAQVP